MKTALTTCGECGHPYHKPIYDLALVKGDVVVHKSWMDNIDAMRKCALTVTDTTHAAEGLYFGEYHEPVYGELITDVRIDTRNHEFVKI